MFRADRANDFDAGHPWPSPFGRAKARPNSLPANLWLLLPDDARDGGSAENAGSNFLSKVTRHSGEAAGGKYFINLDLF